MPSKPTTSLRAIARHKPQFNGCTTQQASITITLADVKRRFYANACRVALLRLMTALRLHVNCDSRRKKKPSASFTCEATDRSQRELWNAIWRVVRCALHNIYRPRYRKCATVPTIIGQYLPGNSNSNGLTIMSSFLNGSS